MLMAAVSPANATNQNITWQSKDDKVAVVDETGYVTPVDTGMTEVVATSEDGSFTSKCFVNVVNYSVKVDNVSIQNSGKDDSEKASLFLRRYSRQTPRTKLLNGPPQTVMWHLSAKPVLYARLRLVKHT